MKLEVSKNYYDMSHKVAVLLLKKILDNKSVNFGLPTGNTPTGMYKIIVDFINLQIPVDSCHFYNIDEYIGVDLSLIGTCNQYLEEHFYNKIMIPSENIHRVDNSNYSKVDYELELAGGLDIVILGIGKNGHIAYNEPGVPFDSITHELSLSKESKIQHSDEFGGFKSVPNKAISMGIKTIMNADCIILMANGKDKADIIKQALQGSITPNVPASILQLHPNLYVFLDQEAALNLKGGSSDSNNTYD